jgi:hypothetical protein
VGNQDQATLVCMLAASIAAVCRRNGIDSGSLTFDRPLYEIILLAQAQARSTLLES